MIESLESRIAPAATLTFMDVDGDLATISTSKGSNADLSEANGVLTFSAPDPGLPDTPRQLLKVDLGLTVPISQIFGGTDLTIKVTKKAVGGDGLVHVGFINAREQILGSPRESIDLGAVTVGGDLGKLEAGFGFATGVKSLTVDSLGQFGLATQGGTGDLLSIIKGGLGSLKVRGDVREAAISVTSSTAALGKIGPVTIGGSLIGGDGPDTGVILATGEVGAVKITGDIRGGDSAPGGGETGASGAIFAGGRMASLTVGGSLLRGRGILDGVVGGNGSLGPVKIGGNVSGTLAPGGAVQSVTIGGSTSGLSFISNVEGDVRVAGDFASVLTLRVPGSVFIGGSMLGGGITGTPRMVTVGGSVIGAEIGAFTSDLRAVKIGGDLIGGSVYAGTETNPTSIADLGTVTIGGSFIGVGTTGRIFSNGTIGSVKIGVSVVGDGDGSATIRSYQILGALAKSHITSVTIGGSLLGGAGVGSAEIDAGVRVGMASANGNLGPVSIRGSVVGAGQQSGLIQATGTIASVKIGGSLTGGAGVDSGEIFTLQSIGAVTVGCDVRGGTINATGLIDGGSIKSVTIGGSLVGGAGNLSGAIFSVGNLGAVKIGHDLQGGSISGTAANLDRAGYIKGGRIASVTIGGSILGGLDTSTAGGLTSNASIRADNDIGAILVKGSIAGTLTAEGRGRPAIAARGQETLAPGATTDLAIKSLTVGGRVDRAIIFAGFDLDDSLTAGSNGNASIGAVRVGGDWIATSLVAGVNDTNDNGFGNGDDQRIAGATLVSRIASITIRGTVAGSAAAGDHFGFTAAQIGSFKAGGFTAKLKSLPADPKDIVEFSLITGDVTLREV